MSAKNIKEKSTNFLLLLAKLTYNKNVRKSIIIKTVNTDQLSRKCSKRLVDDFKSSEGYNERICRLKRMASISYTKKFAFGYDW